MEDYQKAMERWLRMSPEERRARVRDQELTQRRNQRRRWRETLAAIFRPAPPAGGDGE